MSDVPHRYPLRLTLAVHEPTAFDFLHSSVDFKRIYRKSISIICKIEALHLFTIGYVLAVSSLAAANRMCLPSCVCIEQMRNWTRRVREATTFEVGNH